ncbi:MAG: hypothetical protein M5U34_06800 [Chloroflexi bacterium]|nr:hypothetical protein [Chloroflexota bacterium]
MAQALGIEQPPAPLLDYFADMVFSDGSFVYLGRRRHAAGGSRFAH